MEKFFRTDQAWVSLIIRVFLVGGAGRWSVDNLIARNIATRRKAREVSR